LIFHILLSRIRGGRSLRPGDSEIFDFEGTTFWVMIASKVE
jgi:hypothetical protein